MLGSEDQGEWKSKADLIIELMQARKLRKEQCVLVEDDPNEIQRADPVCRTLLVAEAAGITQQHADSLLRMAEKIGVRRKFEKFDLNEDGVITKDELMLVL